MAGLDRVLTYASRGAAARDGVLASMVLAVMLRGQGPRLVQRITILVAVVAVAIYAASYGSTLLRLAPIR